MAREGVLDVVDQLAGLEPHADSRVGFSSIVHLDRLRVPDGPTAPASTSHARWVASLRASEDWELEDPKAYARLDLLAPLLWLPHRAVEQAPLAVFGLRRDRLPAITGSGRELRLALGGQAGLRVYRLRLAGLQLHLCQPALGILSASFAVGLEDGEPASALAHLDVAEAFRRMADPHRAGPPTAVLVQAERKADAADADLAAFLGSDRVAGKRVTRWMADVPPSWLGLPSRDLAVAVLAWLEGRGSTGPASSESGARRAPNAAFVAACRWTAAPEGQGRADVRPDRQFVRTYLRLGAAATAAWTDEVEQEVLRRFALAEGRTYGGGRVGTEGEEISRTVSNHEENAWCISSQGSACLVRTDRTGGWFDHNLPGLLQRPYLLSAHLALFQRVALLDILGDMAAFAAHRPSGVLGLLVGGREARRIRDAVMSFMLRLDHLLVSTNPRHQLLYTTHREVFGIQPVFEDLHRQAEELDDWLSRAAQQLVSRFVAVITVVLMPLNIAFGFFGMNFMELTDQGPSWRSWEPWTAMAFVAGIPVVVGLTLVGAGSWLVRVLARRLARRARTGD